VFVFFNNPSIIHKLKLKVMTYYEESKRLVYKALQKLRAELLDKENQASQAGHEELADAYRIIGQAIDSETPIGVLPDPNEKTGEE
jgi:cellobiose-specific phosphotransferase system component IIA